MIPKLGGKRSTRKRLEDVNVLYWVPECGFRRGDGCTTKYHSAWTPDAEIRRHVKARRAVYKT